MKDGLPVCRRVHVNLRVISSRAHDMHISNMSVCKMERQVKRCATRCVQSEHASLRMHISGL